MKKIQIALLYWSTEIPVSICNRRSRQTVGILSPYRKLFSGRFFMHVPVGLIKIIAGLVIVTKSSNHKGGVIVLV